MFIYMSKETQEHVKDPKSQTDTLTSGSSSKTSDHTGEPRLESLSPVMLANAAHMIRQPIMSDKDLHTFSSHAEVAAAALGSVYAASELGKAIQDHEGGGNEHWVKAAIGATVAVGAYEMLSRKQNTTPGHDHHSHYNHHSEHEASPPHHTRHLLEEAAGAYSLGKELMGDNRHHIAHLVAEAVGATGLIKDIQNRRA
jgi:hypothetical protein